MILSKSVGAMQEFGLLWDSWCFLLHLHIKSFCLCNITSHVGSLTLEKNYWTARARGRGPGQTSKDSLTEQPRVSLVPTTFSATASSCGGFPGRTKTGILSWDTKRWLKQYCNFKVVEFKENRTHPLSVKLWSSLHCLLIACIEPLFISLPRVLRILKF